MKMVSTDSTPPSLPQPQLKEPLHYLKVDYHGDKAYLSQSGQLYAEAGALALGKVYTFGPTFRAEKE